MDADGDSSGSQGTLLSRASASPSSSASPGPLSCGSSMKRENWRFCKSMLSIVIPWITSPLRSWDLTSSETARMPSFSAPMSTRTPLDTKRTTMPSATAPSQSRSNGHLPPRDACRSDACIGRDLRLVPLPLPLPLGALLGPAPATEAPANWGFVVMGSVTSKAGLSKTNLICFACLLMEVTTMPSTRSPGKNSPRKAAGTFNNPVKVSKPMSITTPCTVTRDTTPSAKSPGLKLGTSPTSDSNSARIAVLSFCPIAEALRAVDICLSGMV
mmetsp:Transcript_54461/g.137527  ORF Transcript_54461/g.137527 Transcript_54461/m.137527 type:complete len:271 (+) Transcript_54461:75-887(+)